MKEIAVRKIESCVALSPEADRNQEKAEGILLDLTLDGEGV